MPAVILDLCGGSGAWGKPYADAGYIVYNLTLPRCDITKTTFRNDGYIEFRRPDGVLEVAVNSSIVHGILAAPPCTEFSKAKSTAPRDFEKGMETIEACMKIIWYCQKRKQLKFWALENPEGLLQRFLGNPPYRFEQWWFGNDRCKRTCLWGRYNYPVRTCFVKPSTYQKAMHNKNADWYSNVGPAKRAITPEGFAKAFYKANK